MRIVVMLFCFVALSQGQIAPNIQLQTTSETGERLAGVSVWTSEAMLNGTATETGPDGQLVLPLSPWEYSRSLRPGFEPVFRFSRDGYIPVTSVIRDSLGTVVVLRRGDHGRTLASCDLKRIEFHFGAMGFVLPKGTKAKEFAGGDTWGARVEYKKQVLGFGAGPSWSNGYPTWPSFYDNAEQMWEGEIRGPNGVWFAEYKGVRRNGTYFRWIGAYGITVSYDNVSREAASYFDPILDSLCWYSKI
jgi:hypothetical protein